MTLVPERILLLLIGGLLAVIMLDKFFFDIDNDMSFDVRGETVIVNGHTQSHSLKDLKKVLKRNPQIRTVELDQVAGSDDDLINLKMAKFIRKKGLDTRLTATSKIESGGIELFIGGVSRTIARGAKIGVHEWRDDDDGYDATDIPRDHEDHDPYLKTYSKLGIPKAFYWFVIEAAPPESMYFLSEEEISRFKLATEPLR